MTLSKARIRATEKGQQHPKMGLDEKFHALMKGLTWDHQGFVVVRTSYHPDPAVDEEQWSAAYTKLLKHAGVEPEDDLFVLPVLSDPELLSGMSFNDVERTFVQLVREFKNRPGREISDEYEEDEWPSRVMDYCCLVVDDGSLKSLLAAPSDPKDLRGRWAELATVYPWVIVVDTAYSISSPRHDGKLPYLGWMRALASSLDTLYGDLKGDLDMEENICPPREREGQIGLYTGHYRSDLIDI